MLEMRPDCECCGKDLLADQGGALICSFECSFCSDCSTNMKHICPNCGGDLTARPLRTGDALIKYPASEQRKYAPK